MTSERDVSACGVLRLILFLEVFVCLVFMLST